MDSYEFSSENISSVPPFLVDEQSLLFALNSDTLSTESLAALERVIMKKREEEERKRILEKHDAAISQRKDGRWITRIGPEAKVRDRSQITADSREELEERIIEYYRDEKKSEPKKSTFKEVFEEAEEYYLSIIQDEGKLHSAEQTKKDHYKCYRRFIERTAFESIFIDEIGKKELLALIEHVLSIKTPKKAFNNLRGVLNKVFDYAMIKDYIIQTPMPLIPWKRFAAQCIESSANINDRAYSIDEIGRMYSKAHEFQKEKPYDAGYWAYEFVILNGFRRGEAPPLEWEDVDYEKDFVYLWKELIGPYPYFIKGDVKNRKKRGFPITPESKEFLERLNMHNQKYHPGSTFLFPNEKYPLGCIALGRIYKVHVQICKILDIPISKEFPKGTHAFRRTHETEFIGETGSSQLSQEIYGHNEKTVEEHYRLSQAAKVTAPTVSKIQNKIIDVCTRVHTHNEEKEKPET